MAIHNPLTGCETVHLMEYSQGDGPKNILARPVPPILVRSTVYNVEETSFSLSTGKAEESSTMRVS